MIIFENRGRYWKLDADPETERRVARAMRLVPRVPAPRPSLRAMGIVATMGVLAGACFPVFQRQAPGWTGPNRRRR